MEKAGPQAQQWGSARALLNNAINDLDEGLKAYLYRDMKAQLKYLENTQTGLGDFVDHRARVNRSLGDLIAALQLAQIAENNAFVAFLGHDPCTEPDSEDWYEKELEKDLDIRGLL